MIASSTEELARWWFDPPPKAQAAVAGLRLRALIAARRMNTIKAWLLIAATAAEIAAVGLLAGRWSRFSRNA